MELAEIRTKDPDRTMADILAVATREFAEKGFAGARIDQIAEDMQTSKRMIYYYFGSKDGLYIAVLEGAYRRAREAESEVLLAHLEPEDALRELARFTVEYQQANPDFVRLVMNENMYRGEYIARSKIIRRLNAPAIDAARSIYERGLASGAFRPGIDPLDLHMLISALSFFNVANHHTFSLIFKASTDAAAETAARRETIVEMVLRYVRP